MEPQLEGCGKSPLHLYHLKIRWLQWSRNLRVAESPQRRAQLLAPDRASMEPQLEGCGKRLASAPRAHRALCFNGAAT